MHTFCMFIRFFYLFLLVCASLKALDVTPYLMPEDHPIKKELDTFFSAGRAIFDEEAMLAAGFTSGKPRKYTKVVVAKHPAFPGYVFKVYQDVQAYHKGLPETTFWVWRVQGVNQIREKIAELHYEEYFKCPYKWIYKLPNEPKCPPGYLAKLYILVEEDMDILDTPDNKASWKSSRVTPELLQALYTMLSTLGLQDCAKIDNIPFCQDGLIAFIDTSTWAKEYVRYGELIKSLSLENQYFWLSIVEPALLEMNKISPSREWGYDDTNHS